MDALKLQEDTGVSYHSQVPGVMHACGHDGHTAGLLGAAMILNECRAELRGTSSWSFSLRRRTKAARFP